LATAIAAAEAAVAADSIDEAAYRVLMRARGAAGEQAGALAAYGRPRATPAGAAGYRSRPVDPRVARRDPARSGTRHHVERLSPGGG
jgi:hypothetical protein